MKTDIRPWNRTFLLLPIAILAGCASPPPGPHVAVMPAPGKPFEVFAAEEQYCRSYAQQSIGGANAADAGNERAIGAAAVGTVIGAAAGSAMSGRHNQTGTGAGMGLIFGSAVGAGQGAAATQDLQRRYDIAYQQCMYAKGNQVPGTTYRQAPAVVMPPQYAPPPSYAPPVAYPPPPPPPPH
jgi:hypothetical protein